MDGARRRATFLARSYTSCRGSRIVPFWRVAGAVVAVGAEAVNAAVAAVSLMVAMVVARSRVVAMLVANLKTISRHLQRWFLSEEVHS